MRMKRSIMRYAIFLCSLLLILSIGGVFATWHYVEGGMEEQQEELTINMNGFIYMPEEMPDEEVSLIERLYNILNQKYKTEKVTDSRDYLINEKTLLCFLTMIVYKFLIIPRFYPWGRRRSWRIL